MEPIKLALWAADNRETEKHPHIKSGKPVEINGQKFWLSGYINAGQNNPELAASIDHMITKLSEANDTYPIISLRLMPVEETGKEPLRTAQHKSEPDFVDDKDLPF